MEKSEIRKKINSFERWHYKFNLKGEHTPIDSPVKENRHRQREKYFFTPLVYLIRESLSKKNILDLGCNAGYWSLKCSEAGAKHVTGIDGRKMHINQANFVFEIKDIEKKRFNFFHADIYDFFIKNQITYDVVLCLGLLYHINDPVNLFESMSKINNDILVIDTVINNIEDACFSINHESITDYRNSISSNIVLIPSVYAMIKILKYLGYKGVVLEPDFEDYTGVEDYKKGERVALICAKKTDVSVLYPMAKSVF